MSVPPAADLGERLIEPGFLGLGVAARIAVGTGERRPLHRGVLGARLFIVTEPVTEVDREPRRR